VANRAVALAWSASDMINGRKVGSVTGNATC
jgi:hypothetical protein